MVYYEHPYRLNTHIFLISTFYLLQQRSAFYQNPSFQGLSEPIVYFHILLMEFSFSK